MPNPCPKCSFAVPDPPPATESCPRCGIVFSRVSAPRLARPAATRAAPPPVAASRSRPGAQALGLVALGLVVFVILLPRRDRGKADGGPGPLDLPYPVAGTFAGTHVRSDNTGRRHVHTVELHVNDRMVVDRARWTLWSDYDREEWVSCSGGTEVEYHVDRKEYFDGSRQVAGGPGVAARWSGNRFSLEVATGVGPFSQLRFACPLPEPKDAGDGVGRFTWNAGENAAVARIRAVIPPFTPVDLPAGALAFQFDMPTLWKLYNQGGPHFDQLPFSTFVGFTLHALRDQQAFPLRESRLLVDIFEVKAFAPDGRVEEQGDTRYRVRLEAPLAWEADVKLYKDGRKVVQPIPQGFAYDIDRKGT